MAEVKLIDSDKVKGWTEIVTSLKAEEISAARRERVEIPLAFSLPEGAKPKRIFLDMTVSGVTEKWRVFIGDFSVTKVFKPLLQERYGDEVLSKFVFDVTQISHIVLRDPTLKVVNENNDVIKILQSTLVVLYEYEGLGEFEYNYYVSLREHRSFWGPLNPEKSGYLYGVFKGLPKSSVSIKVGECPSRIVVDDVAEAALECERARSYYVESDGPFIPLSMVTGSYVLNLPRIVILEAYYKDGKVKVKLKNAGEEADDVILLIYTLGMPLVRTSLGRLGRGEEVEREFEVKVNKGIVGLNVRAIWIKAKLRGMSEKFVPV